jgi:Ca-activated chloride channel homolog
MEIIFSRPAALLLAFLIPFVVVTHFFAFGHLKRKAFKFANFESIKRVTGEGFLTRKGRSFLGKNMVLLSIRLLALCVLILGIAGLNLRYSAEVVSGSFVVALDVSSSMLADDFTPNRLEAAKDAITIFFTGLGSDINAGLVSFAGLSFIEMGLTKDRAALSERVTKLGVNRAGGTDITQAIVTSVNLLASEPGYKSVVLITDGRSTVGSPVDIAVEYAVKKGVVVDTIGVGTAAGGRFLDLESVSTLDEPSLTMIANHTGGHYFYAESSQELAQKLLGTIKKERGKRNTDATWHLLALGLVLIMVEWVLSNTKYRSIP